MIVGIDVAKASFDVAWEADGRARHRQFEYTEAGLAALLAATPETAHYVIRDGSDWDLPRPSCALAL